MINQLSGNPVVLHFACAPMIPEHLEQCLRYVLNNHKIYADPYDLALDYGKYGTTKFFPLWILADAIANDVRFKAFLKEDDK